VFFHTPQFCGVSCHRRWQG